MVQTPSSSRIYAWYRHPYKNFVELAPMAEAVAERLGKRQGERSDLATSGNISLSDKGQTRDLAAAKAGPD